jgi:hypothetical protein
MLPLSRERAWHVDFCQPALMTLYACADSGKNFLTLP